MGHTDKARFAHSSLQNSFKSVTLVGWLLCTFLTSPYGCSAGARSGLLLSQIAELQSSGETVFYGSGRMFWVLIVLRGLIPLQLFSFFFEDFILIFAQFKFQFSDKSFKALPTLAMIWKCSYIRPSCLRSVSAGKKGWSCHHHCPVFFGWCVAHFCAIHTYKISTFVSSNNNKDNDIFPHASERSYARFCKIEPGLVVFLCSKNAFVLPTCPLAQTWKIWEIVFTCSTHLLLARNSCIVGHIEGGKLFWLDFFFPT